METINLADTQLTSLTLPEGLESLKELTLPSTLQQLTVPHGMDIYQLVPNPNYRIISYHLEIRRSGNGLEVSWSGGVLQTSASVNGPWRDVQALSPVQLLQSAALSSEFFRLRAE